MDNCFCIILWFVGLLVTIVILVKRGEGYEQASHIVEAAPSYLESWAVRNDLDIKAVEKKSYYIPDLYHASRPRGYAGPFIGRISSGQLVYRVVVTKMGEEKRRVAWIRLGRDMWGMTPESEDFKVIWEDEWRPQKPPIEKL